LPTYHRLQELFREDEGVMRRILLGLSCRNYAGCAEAIPEAFGLSPSTVSRRVKRATERKLRALCERNLEGYDLVALILDGKAFGEDEMVIALGVTLKGEKVILGFVQTASENEAVTVQFLKGLLERGLKVEQGLLCVLDGAKGFRKAVRKALGPQVAIQRCQWHKRENVARYLPKSQQAFWRGKLQRAYEKPTYEEVKRELLSLKRGLEQINLSAARSLEEGLEETLTLHRLGLFAELGTSLKTTNCLESLLSQVGRYTDKVTHWKNSSQKQRWVASALLWIEPRLRRIKGYRHLPKLRAVLLAQAGDIQQVAA
jgi:transposase-like protein